MKFYFIPTVALILLSGCTDVKQIGKVNMISNRNVDPKQDYELLINYAGGSKKELKNSKAVTLEGAIDATVRKVPGGEFLTNTKIYMIKGKYIAVEGDVFGIKANTSYRGFKIGDKVTWKEKGLKNTVKSTTGFVTGIITSLKDDKICLVKNNAGETIEKKYDDISKAL